MTTAHDPTEGWTAELLWVFAVVVSDERRGDRDVWLDAARRLSGNFALPLIEQAVLFACDPPTGRVNLGAISLLIHARSWARRAVPESVEVAGSDPDFEDEVPADLFLLVEDAFEDIDPT